MDLDSEKVYSERLMMGKRKYFPGYKFGMLTYISETSGCNWLMQCDCGNGVSVRPSNVQTGNTISCGCYRRKITSNRSKTHGLRSHKLFSVWNMMRQRCGNPRMKSFKNYGGRGITVCERWDDFIKFYEDMAPSWIDGLTLERINNNLGYSPENCRWATRLEQGANTRRNVMVDTPKGNMVISHACRLFNINTSTAWMRLNKYRKSSIFKE